MAGQSPSQHRLSSWQPFSVFCQQQSYRKPSASAMTAAKAAWNIIRTHCLMTWTAWRLHVSLPKTYLIYWQWKDRYKNTHERLYSLTAHFDLVQIGIPVTVVSAISASGPKKCGSSSSCKLDIVTGHLFFDCNFYLFCEICICATVQKTASIWWHDLLAESRFFEAKLYTNCAATSKTSVKDEWCIVTFMWIFRRPTTTVLPTFSRICPTQ